MVVVEDGDLEAEVVVGDPRVEVAVGGLRAEVVVAEAGGLLEEVAATEDGVDVGAKHQVCIKTAPCFKPKKLK